MSVTQHSNEPAGTAGSRPWRRVFTASAAMSAAMLVVSAAVGGAAAGIRPIALACSQSAIQHALSAGGNYRLDASCDLHLTTPLVMTNGNVTLDGSGAVIEGGVNVNQSTAVRIFIVTGGVLTLTNVNQENGGASATRATPGAGGTDGVTGADGLPGGAGGSGTAGSAAPSVGGDGGSASPAVPAQPFGVGPPAVRGGCMAIGAGAIVHLVGGQLLGCLVDGALGNGVGGSGGRGGSGGNGGPGGTGPGAGGAGGSGGDGSAGGNGGQGRSAVAAEGGAIYNEGTLTIFDTRLIGDRALGGSGGGGGNGGDAGAGGNGGNGANGSGGAPGGDGGNSGAAGRGGNGGNGGNGGSASGGAIYNAGGNVVLAGALLNLDNAAAGTGGNGGYGGSGGNQGQGGLAGFPNGKSGTSAAAGDGGNGGNNGDGGDARGGAIFTTNMITLSSVTFTGNSVGPCAGSGVCSQVTPANRGTAGFGSGGQPGSPGLGGRPATSRDPDVSGPACTFGSGTHGCGTYVALGDSYSSGEGVNTDGYRYFPGTATAHDRCHRSTGAYPALVAKAEGYSPFDGSPGIAGQFAACSGATIPDYLHDNREHNAERAQRAHLEVAGVTPTLLTVSLGGNDLGFGPIVKACVAHGLAERLRSSSHGLFGSFLRTLRGRERKAVEQAADHPCGQDAGELARQLADREKELEALYDQIAADAPVAKILVVGYPNFFPANVTGRWCDGVIAASDAEWLSREIDKFDGEISRAVQSDATSSDVYVAPSKAWREHDICRSSKKTWFIKPNVLGGLLKVGVGHFGPLFHELENLVGEPTLSTAMYFHPNAAGQRELADTILAALRDK